MTYSTARPHHIQMLTQYHDTRASGNLPALPVIQKNNLEVVHWLMETTTETTLQLQKLQKTQQTAQINMLAED